MGILNSLGTVVSALLVTWAKRLGFPLELREVCLRGEEGEGKHWAVPYHFPGEQAARMQPAHDVFSDTSPDTVRGDAPNPPDTIG